MIYIKFIHPDDVYAIIWGYKLQVRCKKCGEMLYVPVELPETSSISQSMGDFFRPFPREKLVLRSDPEPIYIGINRQLSFLEQERLKHFPSVAYVDDNHFDLMIDAYNTEPVEHECIP